MLLSVNLTVAAPSAHLFAKLCVVEPDGSARMIARGQTFIPSPVDEHPVTVYLGHSGHVLRIGERLGVQFAASDFPNYLPWFGDDRDPWRATSGKRVELTIGCGGVIPSRLEIWSR